ncbi:Retrotransposon gag domain [Dillenia turbinata]|uniref:Retrotransposon gag domain n=1 Tax=Dillenia turbinata TaxID=194707 RepID=A0AAN8Z2M1_9MAGN
MASRILLAGWKGQQFFEFHKTPASEKIALAAYHLDGGVHLWYQNLKKTRVWMTWEEFKQAVNDRYGPTLPEDFYGELTKLTQTGSVKDYQLQFNRLLARAGNLTEQQQISCFVSGLKEAIRADVRATNPQSLPHAASLARLFETKHQAPRRINTSDDPEGPTYQNLPSDSPIPMTTTPTNNPPIKRLTPAEIHERRSKNLCFNCDETYKLGHSSSSSLVSFTRLPEFRDEVKAELRLEELRYITKSVHEFKQEA